MEDSDPNRLTYLMTIISIHFTSESNNREILLKAAKHSYF